MFNRKYIFQRSIFPLLCLGEGTGFCAGYFVFATVFFKWKGSTKACQVGVPLHLVLKEGEAFVPPNFWWIFWNWKMGLRKTCTQKRRGLLFHFRSRGTTPGFFVCDSSSPHSYREVSSLSDLYIYIYTYVCTVYFMYLSLSLYVYTYFFPMLTEDIKSSCLLEGGGLCRGSLAWPGSFRLGHARSSRETWGRQGAHPNSQYCWGYVMNNPQPQQFGGGGRN